MSFLKPKAAKSYNANEKLLTSTYSPVMQQGVGASNFLGSLLTGQGDVGAAQGGFDTYLKNAGYETALKDVSKATVGGGAASGLLRSGSTANALLNRAGELRGSMFNNYLGQLFNLSGNGFQAGNLVANAGQKNTGGGPSTAGAIASTVGGIASIFSDRRLKQDIEKIGTFGDGLGLYRFRYIGGLKQFVGVMADEVAKLRPWALGQTIAGFRTVNMGAL